MYPNVDLEVSSKTVAFSYPAYYVKPWIMKDSSTVTIRPIRPEDEPMMVKFHGSLSRNTVYLRYFYYMKLSTRTAQERLARICLIDAERDIVLVADHKKPQTQEHEIIAVGRLSKLPSSHDAEFAILVSDRYQAKGLGTEILRRLLRIARKANIERIISQILPENTVMLRINKKLGVPVHYKLEDGIVMAEIILDMHPHAI